MGGCCAPPSAEPLQEASLVGSHLGSPKKPSLCVQHMRRAASCSLLFLRSSSMQVCRSAFGREMRKLVPGSLGLLLLL